MTTRTQAQREFAPGGRTATEAPIASSFASWLVRKCVGPPCLRRLFARHARRFFFRVHPCAWEADYFGQRLLFSADHDLVELTNDLPLFNTPLRRLAQTLRATDGQLRLLDIGANIGEGIALVDPQAGDQFWLVEGSEAFLPFLRANVAMYPNVAIFSTYVADHASTARGAEVIVAGNAHIDASREGALSFETLDRLFPPGRAEKPNLLKIDIEGHEPKALSGGRHLLADVQPVVFLEWHPKLLRQEGFGVFASLDPLMAAGYDVALVYDNHGLLLGEFRLEERRHLEQLAQYAELRDLFYFDLAVFAPIHRTTFEAFRAKESAFYARWPGSCAPSGP